MRILVSNDDGINARGIHALAEALSEIEGAEIYVSAPHMQRSAAGHGMTLRDSLFMREVPFEGAVKAYEISGTPTDCVKMGLYLLKEQGIEIDMVFSGINHGGNVGTDVIYSGTVAAAMEGAIHGYPAAAVSVDIPYGESEPRYFEYAAYLACEFAKHGFDKTAKMSDEEKKYLQSCGISKNTMLNINVPDLPASQIKGVKAVPLGNREYLDNYTLQKTEGAEVRAAGAEAEKTEYTYKGSPLDIIGRQSNDIDAVQILEKYATVTPVHADLTDYAMMDEIAAVLGSIAK